MSIPKSVPDKYPTFVRKTVRIFKHSYRYFLSICQQKKTNFVHTWNRISLYDKYTLHQTINKTTRNSQNNFVQKKTTFGEKENYKKKRCENVYLLQKYKPI